MAKKCIKKRVCCLSFLVFAVVASLVLRLTFDDIVNAIIKMELKNKLPITNGTTAYGYWIQPPIPVDFRIFVFDIVNPKEVLAGTEVPTVIEKGPYVYKMHLQKHDIEAHPNNTVSYRQTMKFIYDEESSVGPDNETFTTINIPFVTVAAMMQYQPGIVQTAVDMFFRSQKEKTFVTLSVRDIWWGYEDTVLKEAAAILKVFNITSKIITGKFGFYMDRNNTDDGIFNVYSGMDKKFDNYAMIDRWNGDTKLKHWNSPHANLLAGSPDGSMQPPFVSKDSNLHIFDSNMMRTLKLTYNQTSSFHGVDTLRFLVPFSEFAGPKENPENAGFCTPSPNNCPLSGILNMSVIAHNAPVSASLPHFIGGDPKLRKMVKGLKPNQEKHQPFYEYHSITGVALTASRRYQINVRTKPMKHMEAFKNMADAYLPILWIDGLANMDSKTISLFKNEIQDTLDDMVYVKGVLLGCVCLSALILLILVFVWRRKNKKVIYTKDEDDPRQPLLNGHAGNGHIQSITA